MAFTEQQEIDFIGLFGSEISDEDREVSLALMRNLVRRLSDTDLREIYTTLLEKNIAKALVDQTKDAATHVRKVDGLIQKRLDPVDPLQDP